MSFTLLVAMMIALASEPTRLVPPTELGLRLLGVGVGILFTSLFAHVIAARTAQRLEWNFDERARVLIRFDRFQRLHMLVTLVVYGVIVHPLEWPAIVAYEAGLKNWFVLYELLLLLPFLAMQVVAMALFYTAEEVNQRLATERGRPVFRHLSRAAYISFQFRNRFGIMLIYCLIMAAVRGLLSAAPRWQERTELAVPTMLLMSLTFTALAPLILRFVWRAVPLPPGQIRDELLILGKKLRFRFTDILVWPAGGVSNAVVSGLVPQLRYVMLSDALLDKLSPPEIGAVFGHEVGHVKHHHISYYFAFLIGSVGLLSLIALFCQQQAQALFSDAMNRNLDFVFSYVPLELFLLFPYFGLVFGYLSRQCERQADLFGVRAASQAIVDWKTSMTAAFPFLTTSAGHLATTDGCRLGNGHAPAKGWFVAVLADPSTLVEDPPPPAVSSLPKGNYPAVLPEGAGVYAQMLDKLAYLNGISKRAWSWRHGSIASRIEFVETVREDPSLADRFDRRLRRFRWGLLVGLVLGIFVFGWLTGALTLESFPKLL